MKKKLITMMLLTFVLVITSGCGLISKGMEILGDGDSDKEEQTAEGEDVTAEEEGDEEEASEVNADLGDYNIEFAGEVKEEDDQFIIDGESNLIPGSRLVGEVVVDEGETVFSDTSELVQEDGTFHMELEHHEYGDAEIFIRFDFDNVQEDEVIRHYGEKGQKIEGPFVYRHQEHGDIFNKAEVAMNYDADEENDLTIQAPDWLEKPEDYGDPRVWIEVDDVEEDGEYFYLEGHSNMMEGSEIEIKYGSNSDKTQVMPDGSFDFKFDYEYLEDEDMVITFKPSSFQWNEIEEAYGQNGQNLVGNLAKTNKFNTDQQFVEKVIEWDDDDSDFEEEDEDSSDDDSDDNDKEDDDKKDDEDSDDDKKDDED